MKIEIKNISKIYFNKKESRTTVANKNINLNISSGDIVGLVGANGAGKTTFIKMICNLIYPTTGNIEIDGKNLKENKEIAHLQIGVVLEGARNVYNFLSIEENLDYFSYLNRIPQEEAQNQKEYLLELFSLKEKRKSVVNTLSRGMQQKVAIMIAILKNPKILILDEPTLGLDIVSQMRMRELILNLARKKEFILIISTHDMALVDAVCNRVLVFDHGEIVLDKVFSNMKIENKAEYNVIFKKMPYILELLDKFSYRFQLLEGEMIETVIPSDSNILEKIKLEDIYKIEKQNSSIEDMVKKIAEGSYEGA